MAVKVQINLSDGRNMKAELYEDIAPITVANFLKLVDSNFYNGLIFHRVIPNFMIQGGGMTESLENKPADSIKGEFIQNGVKNTLKHTKGVLSMARAQNPNSGSSQFFICVADTPFLDGAYAGFGKLIDDESQKVADDISKVKTQSFMWYDDVPTKPIVIKNIERI